MLRCNNQDACSATDNSGIRAEEQANRDADVVCYGSEEAKGSPRHRVVSSYGYRHLPKAALGPVRCLRPSPDEPALQEMLGRAIRERSGELFSGDAISAT
jgi:hypothetical protein